MPGGRIATAFHFATQFKRPKTLYAYAGIIGLVTLSTFFMMRPDAMSFGGGIAVGSSVVTVVFALRYTYLWAREAIKVKPDYFDSDRP